MAPPPRRTVQTRGPNPGPWEPGANSDIGAFGERDIAFMGGENGWEFFDAPGSHAPNAHGFDGIAYNSRTGETIVYDNKDFLGRLRKDGTRGPAYVGSGQADALTRNLEQNLEETIQKLEQGASKIHPNGQASLEQVLQHLRDVRTALKSGRGWPKKVSLAITNAGGTVGRISPKLERAGIKFIDVRLLQLIKKPTKEGRMALRALRQTLRKATTDGELKALKALAAKRATAVAEKKAAEAVAGRALDKALLRLGAKAAAKRASQLIPLAGAAWALPDAAAGVEDILRGHTARGLAGVGMAIGDVAAQFLNIGDLVSGVGGTVLDVAAQGALAAGQLKLAMERAREKMRELEQEIERSGVPGDDRLRDYYGLDDEAVQDLKQSQQPQSICDPAPEDLPPDPDWPYPLEQAVPPTLEPFVNPQPSGGSPPPKQPPPPALAPAPPPASPQWSPGDLVS